MPHFVYQSNEMKIIYIHNNSPRWANHNILNYINFPGLYDKARRWVITQHATSRNGMKYRERSVSLPTRLYARSALTLHIKKPLLYNWRRYRFKLCHCKRDDCRFDFHSGELIIFTAHLENWAEIEGLSLNTRFPLTTPFYSVKLKNIYF